MMISNTSRPTPPVMAKPRTLPDLPGPRRLPLLGNMLQLDLQQLHLILERWAAQYGPLYQIKLGPKPVVVIADAELNNQILRARPKTYRRISSIEAVAKEMELHGVFSAEGEEWQPQRRLAMQALSSKYLRNFFPTLMRVIERLHRRWQQTAQEQGVVDVQKDFMRMTVDVTTTLAFGYDMNTLEKENDVIQNHLEKLFPMIGQRINAPFPYWRYIKLPADRALDRALGEIHTTLRTFIREARQRMAAQPLLRTQPTNFLEAMLALEGSTLEEAEGVSFTDQEILANVFTMLLAGEDTTANTLSWILYYLAQHPAVQYKLQAEADAVLGNGDLLAKLEDADKLPYMEAVANEVMRLRPVAPVIPLETNEAVALAGLHLPQGTALFLLTRPGVLDDQNFADAQSFHPERWLADAGCPVSGPHNRQVNIPFGHGPRLCPGRSLALLEIKATLAMIGRHFTVSLVSDPAQVREVWAFAMMPAGLAMRFTPRRG